MTDMTETNGSDEMKREIAREDNPTNVDDGDFRRNRVPTPSCCNYCIADIAEDFPRATTICCRIVFPLWILICIAAICGYFLALQEAPSEYDRNDQIISKRFIVEQFPLDESLNALFELPSLCFETYLYKQNETEQEEGLLEAATLGLGENATPELFRLGNDEDEIIEEIRQHMDQCGGKAEAVVRALLDYTSELVLLADPAEQLSFNWIRCWNVSRLGSFVVYSPSEEQMEAAARQREFYEYTWREDRIRLYEKYLDEVTTDDITFSRNASLAIRSEAFKRSLHDATARDSCTQNTSGSAWFWFTVMTTVGYGNQAPETEQGRAMVITLGFLSMLAFGGILATSGGVVKVLFNDTVARCRLGFLTRPLIGSLFWGATAIFWMNVLGARSRTWWNHRLEDFEVSQRDAFWFGFISSTTVGLGDYWLQPEVMFLEDVFRFSLLFLTGFVFTSAFLNSFGGFMSEMAPRSAHETLEERLKHTNMLQMERMESSSSIEEEESNETIHELEKLVAASMEATTDDGNSNKSLAALLKETELLQKLVDRTREDLAVLLKDRVTSEENGECPKTSRELCVIQKEEDLLKELLERTISERLQVESNTAPLEGSINNLLLVENKPAPSGLTTSEPTTSEPSQLESTAVLPVSMPVE